MKIYIIHFIVILLAASCVVENKENDYTYSIEKIWWSHEMDGNDDGYVQYKRLNFNVHLAEDAVRTIGSRIYYKLSGASNYSFYAYSSEKQVAGQNIDNEFTIPIGSPNKKLPHGKYDFAIEIYEQNSEHLEAKNGSIDSLVLVNNAIEPPDNDNSLTMSFWWENQYDFNENGYCRHAKLFIDANITRDSSNVLPLSKTVIPKIYYRSSKQEKYTLYHKFSETTIAGESLTDTISCVIGNGNEEIGYGNQELTYDSYNFLIELYDATNDKLLAFADYLTPELNDRKFETKQNDSYNYSVKNLHWQNNPNNDLDGDKYTTSRILKFDVDVDKENVKRSIYAKIFLHSDTNVDEDSLEYTQYDSTKTYDIFGGKENTITVEIGSKSFDSSRNLDSNKYNFFISIFDEARQIDTVETYVASFDFFNDTTLFQQKFEKAEQDKLK